MGVAIVAIPSADDPVWKQSSETTPHLTLLFLGDKLNNVPHVQEYVQHAADSMLSKFYLDVDDRGVLGNEKADVLFFDASHAKTLVDFRQSLLTNIDIFTAYQSIEQFPTWIPHLTMGYPDRPAKDVDSESLRVHSVRFDRIALWTGNFEGVEFPLKSNNDVLSMSAKGEAFMKHYGIKGMKWGVVRDRIDSVSNSAPVKVVNAVYGPSKDSKAIRVPLVKAQVGGVKTLSNAEMRAVINRMELEKRYRDLYGEHQLHDEGVARAKRWAKKGARWAGKFTENVATEAATSWISRPGGGGRRNNDPVRVKAWTTGQQFAEVVNQTPRRAISS